MSLLRNSVKAVLLAALIAVAGRTIDATSVTAATPAIASANALAALPPATGKATVGEPGNGEPASGEPAVRLREGSKLVEQVGSFRLQGDGLAFVSSDGRKQFGGLPNLALERVAKIVGDSVEPVEWVVSGTVTEYRGANYLFITQATLKAKPVAVRGR